MSRARPSLLYVGWILVALAVGTLGGYFVANESDRRVNVGNGPLPVSVLAADWNALSPKLVWAVEKARSAAQKRAQAELDIWRERMMRRVDPEFLNWHFDYFNKRYEDLIWIWRHLTSGKDQADLKYIEAIAAGFAEKVFPFVEVQVDMERIAKAVAQEFHDELIAIVSEYRREFGAHAGLLDARLERTEFVAFDGDQRPVRVNLKSLSSRSGEGRAALYGIELQLLRDVKSTDPGTLAGAEVARVAGTAIIASKAATSVFGAAKTLGASKTAAAALGTSAAAVVVIAAIGGHEWWAHSEYVKEQRPKLRDQIEASLRHFTDAALREDGRFGSSLETVASALTTAIRRQETAWGRLITRIAQYVPL